MKRNRARANQARFITAELEDADLGDELYHKIVAIDVAALYRPGKALDVTRERLADGGSLYLFSQAPGWRERGDAERFGADLGTVLDRAGFSVAEVRADAIGSGFVAAVIGA